MSIFQGIGNRGGNRGGRDQFNWDDVRGDKYKDYYLGQSVNLQKRWWLEGKNQVGTTKAVLTGEGIDKRRDRRALEKQKSKDEISQIKQQEQIMFMQEMGILPKGHYRDAKKLEKHEFKEMCKRGTIEKDENDVDRMGGIGFSQVPALSAEERVYYREDGDAPTSLAQPKDEFVPVGKSAHVTVSSKKEEKHSKKEKKSKKDKKHKKEKKEKKKRRHESDEKDKGHKRHKRDEEMDDRSRDGRRHRHDSEDEKDSRRDAKNFEEKRRHDSDEERSRSRSYRHDSDEERSHRRRHDSNEERSSYRRERHDSGDEDNSKTRSTETRERRRHDSEERPTHRRERHDSDEERPTHRRERHDSDEE